MRLESVENVFIPKVTIGITSRTILKGILKQVNNSKSEFH